TLESVDFGERRVDVQSEETNMDAADKEVILVELLRAIPSWKADHPEKSPTCISYTWDEGQSYVGFTRIQRRCAYNADETVTMMVFKIKGLSEPITYENDCRVADLYDSLQKRRSEDDIT